MVIYRLLQRVLIYLVWLIILSILGFAIAISNTAISFNPTNYLKFVQAFLHEDFFIFQPLNTSSILRLTLTTFELVISSTIFAILLSWLIVTFTIRHPAIFNRLFNFFSFIRVIPFIILPLLFNEMVGTKLLSAVTQLDESRDISAYSRFWVILSGQTDNAASSLINFLLIIVSASFFIVPMVFVIIAKVTRQVTQYSYAKVQAYKWTSTQIMAHLVNHRLFPVLLKELPALIASFVFFVGILEYLFQWRGVIGTLFKLFTNQGVYSIQIGVAFIVLSSCLLTIHLLCTLLSIIYDRDQRNQLPYEID